MFIVKGQTYYKCILYYSQVMPCQLQSFSDQKIFPAQVVYGKAFEHPIKSKTHFPSYPECQKLSTELSDIKISFSHQHDGAVNLPNPQIKIVL